MQAIHFSPPFETTAWNCEAQLVVTQSLKLATLPAKTQGLVMMQLSKAPVV
ncbi:hypothetical protein DPMN_143968 [Dreissena polymorpha]|uniref:Uncharacterized protein n=1 Tax=Dreissena polymorpha TaxID=45954 RepID=A0A9D4GI12_DREPO|nr:hypothetical protein DPMN_143968 [Dreissena polymorpha]